MAEVVAHTEPGPGEILRNAWRPMSISGSTRLKSRARLHLVTQGPIRTGNRSFVHPIQPSLGFLKVERAVASRLASAPLGDEQRTSIVQSRLCFLPEWLLVRSGIKVERVCHILIVNWILTGNVHILRPSGRAQNHKIL